MKLLESVFGKVCVAMTMATATSRLLLFKQETLFFFFNYISINFFQSLFVKGLSTLVHFSYPVMLEACVKSL